MEVATPSLPNLLGKERRELEEPEEEPEEEPVCLPLAQSLLAAWGQNSQLRLFLVLVLHQDLLVAVEVVVGVRGRPDPSGVQGGKTADRDG